MLSLLKKLYIWFENFKGKKLLLLFLLTFLVFLAAGLIIGYFTNSKLNKGEQKVTETVELTALKSFEGKVTYTGAPTEDDISYVLSDTAGKDIILLKASDSKLKIVEGLNAKVKGTVSKTKSGKDVLTVQEVSIKNATD